MSVKPDFCPVIDPFHIQPNTLTFELRRKMESSPEPIGIFPRISMIRKMTEFFKIILAVKLRGSIRYLHVVHPYPGMRIDFVFYKNPQYS